MRRSASHRSREIADAYFSRYGRWPTRRRMRDAVHCLRRMQRCRQHERALAARLTHLRTLIVHGDIDAVLHMLH